MLHWWGSESSWNTKLAGDAQQYTKGEATVCYAVNVIKSLRWPGAITVSKGGRFSNLYIGYGIKRTDPSFNPTMPPNVDKEPEDPEEQPEPTPLHEPEVKAAEEE